MKLMGLEEETLRLNVTWDKAMMVQRGRFAICVDNSDYEASLILRKIYEVIPDEQGAADDLLRIVDESGEDYLYHHSHFVLVDFPPEVEHALLASGTVS